ncbi:uncharacterized protein LOC130662751 isoform X2 [Hydractinia symbiolongicarpus]|nr:uncharacterized protein LOC130662751 isoform X2 [Hydractinia symbiolongicarpus]
MAGKRKLRDSENSPQTISRITGLSTHVHNDLHAYHKNAERYSKYLCIDKPVKKENSFHVSRLLQENKKAPSIHNTDYSAFKVLSKSSPLNYFERLYKKRMREHNELTMEIDRFKPCSKSCCVPSPSSYPRHSPTVSHHTPTRFSYSPILSRRSSETSSANSSGSTCNSRQNESNLSCETDEEHQRSPILRIKNTICHGPCCGPRTPGEKSMIRKNIDRHFLPFVPYRKVKKEINEESYNMRKCSCPQCYIDTQFEHREPLKGIPYLAKKNSIDTPENLQKLEIKPISKRKALIGELGLHQNVRKEEEREGNKEGKDKHVSSTDLINIPPGPNRSRAVANLLERRRVAELNSAFGKLRLLVPSYGDEDRTLSKIKTLKYALNYMYHLTDILNMQAKDDSFDVKTYFVGLCRKDPLIQKCQEHMMKRNVIQ